MYLRSLTHLHRENLPYTSNSLMVLITFFLISSSKFRPFLAVAFRGSPYTPLPVSFGKEPGIFVILEYATLDFDNFLEFGLALSILTSCGAMASKSEVST